MALQTLAPLVLFGPAHASGWHLCSSWLGLLTCVGLQAGLAWCWLGHLGSHPAVI